jgi:hypothetical protein
MNCDAVARLLDLVDADARCDRVAIGRHFARCVGCARRWPEIAAFVVPRRRPRTAARVAAAVLACAVALGALVSRIPDQRAEGARTPEAAGAAAAPAWIDASISRQSTRHDRGRQITSSVTHSVWRPPPPRCLRQEGAGT